MPHVSTCLFIFLLESELKDLAQKLRHHTLKTTQIEIAPWAKAYTVDIKDIYTELSLEELFPIATDASGNSGGKQSTRKRILIKGNEGFGKTTISKKIMHDWSTETFTTFDLVFRVSLQNTRPGDSIEHAVLEQTPILKNLGIFPEKLEDLFDIFGYKCLIILDGSCEDPKIINKMMESIGPRCSIVGTTLPHVAERCNVKFDNVAELEGLRSDSAKQYVSQILKERSLVGPVLKFNDVNFMSGPGFASPLLLSFISILADNHELDLTEEGVGVGDIYFQLVRFLFNKSLLKKGSTFSEERFMNFLVQVGEVGLKGLIEGGPLKMQAFSQLDVDPLEMGIFSVHETSPGLSDPNAEVFLSFAHSTLQYFLSSIRFVHAPKDIGAPSLAVIIMRPLFFNFCLWASGSQTSPIASEAKAEAYNTMTSFVAKEIDAKKFNLRVICKRYPVLELCFLFYRRNKQYLKFIQISVSLCGKVKHVILDKIANVDGVLEMLQPLWQQVTTVQIFEGEISWCILEHIKSMSFSENLTLITDSLACRMGNSLVDHCQVIGKKCSWYLLPYKFESSTDLSMFFWYNIEEVHINPLVDRSLVQGHLKKPNILFSSDVFKAPKLKRLSLCNLLIDRKTVVFISTAMREGKLPKLTDLSLAGSDFSEDSHLLFQCTWPSLIHLDLNKCTMSEEFVTSLLHAFRNIYFPELMSLNIWGNIGRIFPTLPSRLTELSFSHRSGPFFLSKSIFQGNRINQHKLRTFDLSNSSGVSGRLYDCFKCNSFPLLQTLVLRNCNLNSQDMISLAEARVEGKLPELKDLDISQNSILIHEFLEALHSLCQLKCIWESLLSLNIISLLTASFCDLCRLVNKGCFGSLEELHISARNESELIDVIDIRFPFLRNLYINCGYGRDQTYAGIIGKKVQDMISKGIFPSLKICIVCTGEVTCNHGTSCQQSHGDDEETVIEKCSGYLIPSMMYLSHRRAHRDEKHALTSPSEAMATSQFSGSVSFFFHVHQYENKHGKVADLIILPGTKDFSSTQDHDKPMSPSSRYDKINVAK